jgi:hypothetical protein
MGLCTANKPRRGRGSKREKGLNMSTPEIGSIVGSIPVVWAGVVEVDIGDVWIGIDVIMLPPEGPLPLPEFVGWVGVETGRSPTGNIGGCG